MTDIELDGIKQFSAGASLIVSTHLLQWDEVGKFKAYDSSNAFETCWTNFNQQFGRAAMWNIFSTGAELLLKGVLLKNNKMTVGKKPALNYPKSASELVEIGKQCFLTNKGTCDVIQVPQYGTLDSAITKFRDWKGKSSPSEMDASEEAYVITAFEILRDTIRNRDTHAYVENVRDSHYHLVNEIFLNAFNICLSYMGNSRQEISKCVIRNKP